MLCAAFHRAGKSRDYTVESQNSRVAEGEESLAQVLLEQSRTSVRQFQKFVSNVKVAPEGGSTRIWLLEILFSAT